MISIVIWRDIIVRHDVIRPSTVNIVRGDENYDKKSQSMDVDGVSQRRHCLFGFRVCAEGPRLHCLCNSLCNLRGGGHSAGYLKTGEKRREYNV